MKCKQFRILKVQAAFAIKLWISGQTCPMKANFVFANLIFCLIWSNWDDQNSSFEPPYSFLSQGSKGEGEEGGGGPEGEGVQGGVQRALLPRVPVSSSRRSNCGSECLSVFLSEPEFQWDFIKFKMLFNEFSVKKLSLNDMWIFNCLCQIWLTFESAQRKQNACTENEKIAETLLINQSQILDGCSSGSCTWRIIWRMHL